MGSRTLAAIRYGTNSDVGEILRTATPQSNLPSGDKCIRPTCTKEQLPFNWGCHIITEESWSTTVTDSVRQGSRAISKFCRVKHEELGAVRTNLRHCYCGRGTLSRSTAFCLCKTHSATEVRLSILPGLWEKRKPAESAIFCTSFQWERSGSHHVFFEERLVSIPRWQNVRPPKFKEI